MVWPFVITGGVRRPSTPAPDQPDRHTRFTLLSSTPPPDPLQAVNGPAGPAPRRRAGSIRRTSTLDGTWPDGFGAQLRLHGRARDAVTDSPLDSPIVVAEATARVGLGANRIIEDIDTDPSPDGVRHLIGCRGGGYLRAALAEFVPDQLERGTPLYLLLDDISGTSLVAGVAWLHSNDKWSDAGSPRPPRPEMEGVCIGFAPGSSALVEFRSGVVGLRMQAVGSLVRDDDRDGWHELGELPPISFRRARRIDVWRDPVDATIMIDAGFQDSTGRVDGDRIAIHEYGIRATADPRTLTVASIEPDPRILPYLSCPNAVATAATVVGTPLAELRTTVLDRLAKANGCTHLNDALRALADVPALLTDLDAGLADPRR